MHPVTLVLGSENDCHAQHMMASCENHGLNPILFDTADFPTSNSISWNPSSSKNSLKINQKRVRFAQIKSVFWSTISSVTISENLSENQQQISISDSISTLRTFLSEPKIKWVNSWAVFDSHRVKPRQLERASMLGATIPETFIGNDSKRILAFVKQYKPAIFKPVYGGAHSMMIEEDMLSPLRLERVLQFAPVTIQRFIPGTNIRTYVIGDHVYSAEIVSSNADFRTESNPEHIPFEPPPSISQLAKRVTKGLGMYWTAIDWRRDETGKYYFLEANPSPMFIHFEKVTGYPITEKLIELLK